MPYESEAPSTGVWVGLAAITMTFAAFTSSNDTCSGPLIAGWDPKTADGKYHLVGTYDGHVFTLTQPPSAVRRRPSEGLPSFKTHVDLIMQISLHAIATDPFGDTLSYRVVSVQDGTVALSADGQSLLFGPDGSVLARARQFEEELLFVEVPGPGDPKLRTDPLPDLDEVYEALVLGLRDYVEKNGFGHVGLGISGGIDSALVAMLAVDALGPERVTLVVMPSPHSSAETQEDARQIARNLGTELIDIEIEPMMEGYRDALDVHLRPDAEDADASPTDPTRPSEPDLAAENIQARIRGNLMMALSNRHGWLVLTTGNKSEMSVGYATLYGDMAGGFAVVKDVPKGLVYDLVRRRNERAGKELVPASVIDRPPSAELRPDQLDSDSLPPYDLLDRILEAYVERDEGREEMIAAGLPAATVDDVIRLVDRSEYKRRQAAPGIRITPKAFGRDRRLPITNRFGG